MDITGSDLNDSIITVSAQNRNSRCIEIQFYAVLVLAGKYGGQTDRGVQRYDMRRNNITTIAWVASKLDWYRWHRPKNHRQCHVLDHTELSRT